MWCLSWLGSECVSDCDPCECTPQAGEALDGGCLLIELSLFVVVLHDSNSISVISWQ